MSTIERPFGEVFTPEEVAAAVKQVSPKVVGIVHAETSTGARQPIEEISKIVHDSGSLLLVDCVTSLGGLPVEIDGWGVDLAYSATQKCLGVPPGLAPFTASARAIERLVERFPATTIVHPGHGPETTLGDELARNPFLAPLRSGRAEAG